MKGIYGSQLFFHSTAAAEETPAEAAAEVEAPAAAEAEAPAAENDGADGVRRFSLLAHAFCSFQ